MDYELIHAISEIDREILKIQKELQQKGTLEVLVKMKQVYSELKQEYELKASENMKNSNRAKELSDRVDVLSKELKENDIKLYQTSNMKSIEALQKSIDKLQAEIKADEEEAYNLFSKVEAFDNSKKVMIKELETIKLRYNSIKDEYNAHLEQIKAILSELNIKRGNLSKQVTPQVMEEYESIRKSKRYGMSMLKGEICTGCGIGIPYIIISEVRRNKTLAKCPNCGRFIHIE